MGRDVDEITLGYDPCEPSVLHYGETAHFLLAHDLHRVLSKNTNELKTRVSRGVSDRRVYAYFAKGS